MGLKGLETALKEQQLENAEVLEDDKEKEEAALQDIARIEALRLEAIKNGATQEEAMEAAKKALGGLKIQHFEELQEECQDDQRQPQAVPMGEAQEVPCDVHEPPITFLDVHSGDSLLSDLHAEPSKRKSKRIKKTTTIKSGRGEPLNSDDSGEGENLLSSLLKTNPITATAHGISAGIHKIGKAAHLTKDRDDVPAPEGGTPVGKHYPSSESKTRSPAKHTTPPSLINDRPKKSKERTNKKKTKDYSIKEEEHRDSGERKLILIFSATS
eukprot:Gregarina_sp_Poly_1__4308@NODE_233_length_11059_cov_49_751365_g206_i0_p3_GENE_NODE_233_length_11059_cov_49_751365_g206_i0NODE_233_length_11059_cov_49_751365_g206_i0_p3_ORF_typecomplete_len270_score56_47DUF5633/PF18656_1/0_06DUF5633/PF18656_1/6_6e02HicB_lk_antitox/PF15919_5/0_11HicB_lk_antitox/PF15919_5/1_2e04MT/PF12777_7/5_5_NODE_233_length_11059_cov_49_751365_g206_i039764785